MVDVIFNADDFGLTTGVTEAIIEAAACGVVRSTSALVCRGNLELLRDAAPRFRGSIGLHLQLTDGVPCLPPERVPSLVDDDGRFPRNVSGLKAVAADEVYAEWRAQHARARSLGIKPSHIDSHHHVHRRDEVLEVYVELARSLGVPARSGDAAVRAALLRAGVPCPATCETSWFRPRIEMARLLATLRKNAARFCGEPIEFMCHPGYADDELRAASTLVEQRQEELALLTAPELGATLKNGGYRAITMTALAERDEDWGVIVAPI
jgi:predicted glycoside hydrolase/deacetylase ChbG (UPF0249 family)